VKAFPPKANALETPDRSIVPAPRVKLHPLGPHFLAESESERRKCGGLAISLAPQLFGCDVDAEAPDPMRDEWPSMVNVIRPSDPYITNVTAAAILYCTVDLAGLSTGLETDAF
jgi:hypothetical protein